MGAYGISLLISYPLQLFPANQIIETQLLELEEGDGWIVDKIRLKARMAIACFILLLAIYVPSITLYLGLLGCVLSAMLLVIETPSIVHAPSDYPPSLLPTRHFVAGLRIDVSWTLGLRLRSHDLRDYPQPYRDKLTDGALEWILTILHDSQWAIIKYMQIREEAAPFEAAWEKSTPVQAFFNFLKTLIGIGIIALPYATNTIGWFYSILLGFPILFIGVR